MTQQEAPRPSYSERVLGAIATGVLLLSAACVLFTVFWPEAEGRLAPTLQAIPLIGLPIGILLIVSLTVVTILRRRREQQ